MKFWALVFMLAATSVMSVNSAKIRESGLAEEALDDGKRKDVDEIKLGGELFENDMFDVNTRDRPKRNAPAVTTSSPATSPAQPTDVEPPPPESQDQNTSFCGCNGRGCCSVCSVVGPPGPMGPQGPMGQAGSPGRDGRDGRDAPISIAVPTPGFPNTTPPSAVTSTPSSQSGSVYVRWGRTVCNSSSELLYSGILGGSIFRQEGNGVNYLCLPEDPTYDQVEVGVQNRRAYIHGGEYKTSGFGNLASVDQHVPPCAVCLARGRSAKLMIPGRNTCPTSAWTLEYKGYLMATVHDYFRSEYICVDENAEARGTAGTLSAAEIYLVEGRCATEGGIPCGPYVDGYELTCAVCTI